MFLPTNKPSATNNFWSGRDMTGFRNLAIHEYTSIDLDKLKYIIELCARQKNYRVIPEIFVLKNYPESSVFLLDPG